jgi:broad specificity phosphatase PhoE
MTPFPLSILAHFDKLSRELLFFKSSKNNNTFSLKSIIIFYEGFTSLSIVVCSFLVGYNSVMLKGNLNGTIVYIARHGQTDWNHEKRFQGHFDIPLNETGRQQAEALANCLVGKNISAIYSSPKNRALETAEIIGKVIGCEVETVAELREITHGIFDGLTMAEVYSRKDDAIVRWREDRINVAPPDGESIKQCYDRVVPIFDDLVQSNKGKVILIVSHLVVTKSLLTYCLDAPLETFWRFDQDSATLNKIRYNERGPVVESLNHICHLESV